MTTSPAAGSLVPSEGSLLEGVAKELKRRIRREQFETWFRGIDLVQDDKAEVVFSVPNGFVRDWITRNYLDELERAVTAVCGAKRRVRVNFAATASQPAESATDDLPQDNSRMTPARLERTEIDRTDVTPSAPPPAPAVSRTDPLPATRPADAATGGTTRLNEHYTFEEFVVGSCNRLAHAAAMAIGDSPGRAYNPFFVHGNVGLGKTHLLQAICHAILRRQPNARVVYVSCEEFTNRFIESIQNSTLSQFRDFHRNADVLVIDDVEFLAHKSQTQEEFFHTFNALYNRQAQIVLSSDRRAPEIPTLEERLVSRFKWGLETDMTRPCFETRAAIVRRKARIRSVDLPADVVHCLAETVTSNIRELEGAVTKVLGLATITGCPIDLALAEKALREGAVMRSRLVTMADIMDMVTREFSISAKDLLGKSRTQAISRPAPPRAATG